MIGDMKLLVVDDEDVICQACRRILSPQGFQVETSNDAREGLRLATEEDYAAMSPRCAKAANICFEALKTFGRID